MQRKVVVSNNELLDNVASMIASGSRVVLLTKGHSMLPFIVGNRDSVELSRVDNQIEVGDILLVKLAPPISKYIIHRVIEIEVDKITLMGDGNVAACEECRREDVVARVTAIIKPKKTIDPNSKHQRKLASLWLILRPLRRYVLAVLRRVMV